MNASEAARRKIEMDRVQVLLRLLGRPTELIEPQRPPEPDIRVGDIGIEVTAVGSEDFAAENAFKRVLQDAKVEYEQRNGPPIRLVARCSFQGKDPLPAALMKPWKAALVEWLFTATPGQKGTVSSPVEAPAFPGLEEIQLEPANFTGGTWFISGAANPGYISVAALELIIGKKDRLIDRYERSYGERWLLIHNGQGAEPVAASRVFPYHLTAHTFSSRFDRIFLLHSAAELSELRVCSR